MSDRKPTISELEEILRNPSPHTTIEIRTDGSIRAVEHPEVADLRAQLTTLRAELDRANEREVASEKRLDGIREGLGLALNNLRVIGQIGSDDCQSLITILTTALGLALSQPSPAAEAIRKVAEAAVDWRKYTDFQFGADELGWLGRIERELYDAAMAYERRHGDKGS